MMTKPINTLLGGACLAIAAMAAAPSLAATKVDLELQLLVDVSGSVSASEFGLQRGGYSTAFRSTTIQNAITDTSTGRLGSIAAQLIYWSSGLSGQAIGVDWFLIDDATSANAFADAIDAANRPFFGGTDPAAAINFGFPLFDTNDFDGAAQIIDVSGDGTGNATTTRAARDAALKAGVERINGLAIGSTSIETWYIDNIKGGEDSFVILAATFGDFTDAVTKKLELEITSAPPTNPPTTPIPLPAAFWLSLAGIGALAGVSLKRKA